MVWGFFKKKRKPAFAPDGKRIYAVGDVHGCADLLDLLLDKMADDGAGEPDARVVFLGDYVDRGPDSKGVIDRLLDIQTSHPETVFLKGNHEAVMLDFMSDPEKIPSWLKWGGDETLASYGVLNANSRPGSELSAELNANMPPAHKRFLNGLTLTHAEGDYLFVHAGVKPGVALDNQREEDLLWIRKRFHEAPASKRPEQVVVHGHHPVKKPLDAGWRIDVDTGACWTDRLTAVVLEDDQRRFIST